MKKIKTILFDLDGTLIDTEPPAARAIEESFASWGITVTHEDAGYVTGRTWEKAFDYLFAKYPVAIPREEAEAQMMAAYREGMREELITVPGGVEAVQALAPHYKLALVSGSYRSEILFALETMKVRKHFEVILGAEDYPRSKPAPDGYLKALQALGFKGEESLVFEDSAPGIASGLAAGAWVVAITSTNHFGHDQSQAHAQIPDLRGVDLRWVGDLEARLVKLDALR